MSVREDSSGSLAPERVSSAERQQTIEALKPPKRPRPAIAILALNEGTEISDFLTTYGVLAESGAADVVVVAQRADPIRLYPTSIKVETQATMAHFGASYPEGADYVVVPAMNPPDDAAIVGWINAQHRKGATIVSVCDGSLTLSAAGLLDDRRATGHWYSIAPLRKKHPTMTWVPDRRYVVDRNVATSTGITASIPLMMTLVEAIGDRAEAEKLAMRLGVADWDARHDSAAFKLTLAHKKTFLRNKLMFWRRDAVPIKVGDHVDEIALGLMADAHSRTGLSKVIGVGGTAGFVQSRRGLRLQPDAPATAAGNDTVLEPPSDQPARTLDRELPRIASRYGDATAAFVALVMEYPWIGRPPRPAQG